MRLCLPGRAPRPRPRPGAPGCPGRPLAGWPPARSGLRSLPGSPSSFLTQATDKRFPSSHIWIMAFLTSCSGIETILFRWNGVNSSYEDISPRTALPAPPPPFSRPAADAHRPRAQEPDSQRPGLAHVPCCTPGEHVPVDGTSPRRPCPERLLAVSRLRGHTRVPGSSFRRASSLGDAELHV